MVPQGYHEPAYALIDRSDQLEVAYNYKRLRSLVTAGRGVGCEVTS